MEIKVICCNGVVVGFELVKILIVMIKVFLVVVGGYGVVLVCVCDLVV